jgi:hypothetical protein
MKQDWFRGTVSSIRPSGHRAVFVGGPGGRLLGETGLSLPERAGPPRFEDLWEAGGAMPAKARQVIEVEPRFTGIEVVLGLMENRDGRTVSEVFILARTGDRLVALLAIDATCSGACPIETRVADAALRAQRFCATSAILVLHSVEQSASTDKHGAFDHYAAMAAARGIPSAKRNVLHLVDGASKVPVFTAWIDSA